MVITRRQTVVEEPATAAPETVPATAPATASAAAPSSRYRTYDGGVPATTTADTRYATEAPTTAAPVVDGNAADEPTAAERAEADAEAADERRPARTGRLNRLLHR